MWLGTPALTLLTVPFAHAPAKPLRTSWPVISVLLLVREPETEREKTHFRMEPDLHYALTCERVIIISLISL